MIRNWCNQNQCPALQHRWVPTEITLKQKRRTYGKPYGQLFPKTVVTQLSVLPNIYRRVKFDLVSCSFNSTERRHVNIVDLSTRGGGGEGGYSEIFPIHRLGVFLGSEFRISVFLGGLQKQINIFGVGNFVDIFGGSKKMKIFWCLMSE